MLVKITPDKELRRHYKGRGGRDLPNTPRNLEELEDRYVLLWHYLDTHGVLWRYLDDNHVLREDRCFRPASYAPVPSKKQVCYAYILNDNRAIAQLALQCRRMYGLHVYREGVGKELPPEVLEEVAS
jgi:hypothetical protein